MTPAYGSVLLLLAALVFYVTELIPIPVTAMGSCVLLSLFGFAKASTVWSGISGDTTLFVGGMIAIITAVIETGAAKTLCSYFAISTGKKVRSSAFMVILLVILISGFMNNSAAVAITLPILAGIIAVSGNVIHEKHWFMPLAVGSNVGGMLTVIGTTSQMVIQNALIERNLPVFGFFEFAWVGVPMCILFLLYFVLFGKTLNKILWPDVSEHTKFVKEVMAEYKTEKSNAGEGIKKGKQVLSISIMVGTIVCITLSKHISNGTIAMLGVMLVIITGCIPFEKLVQKFDWTTIFVLAGGIGFAKGLDESGGGRLIAEWISEIFGNSLTPMHVFAIFVITGAILTVFMSNTAVAAMLTPIAFAFTGIMDFNIIPVLMGICMATNCAFSTPIATPSMTMVLGPGEYRFVDYVKYCMLFNVLAVALLFFVIPRVWPL